MFLYYKRRETHALAASIAWEKHFHRANQKLNMKFLNSLCWAVFYLSITALPSLEAAEASTPADYVNPLVDTEKSRWFYFSSACRPFGLGNLNPEPKDGGGWRVGV